MSLANHPMLAALRASDTGKVVSARDAVRLISDGDTVATGGFVGIGFAENIAVALEERFLAAAESDPHGAGSPSGLVTFRDGATVLGSALVDEATRQATLQLPSLAVGDHDLTASYPGDARFAGSAGAAPLALPVGKAAVSVAVRTSPSSSARATSRVAPPRETSSASARSDMRRRPSLKCRCRSSSSRFSETPAVAWSSASRRSEMRDWVTSRP